MYVFRAIVQIRLFLILLSYEIRCPDFLERSILSKQCSNEEPFHCLSEDNSKRVIYLCRKWEWVAKGSCPVLSGRYINYKDCNPNTYQPFIYKSTEDYKCEFNKSLCKELGNVIVHNGTTVTNRLCGCDHTRGYAFVVGATTGSCNPVVEDCSCYLQQCDLGQKPNQDNNCIRDDTGAASEMERSTINRPIVDINAGIRSTKLKEQLDFFNILYAYRKYILTALIMISLAQISAHVSVIVLCKMKDKETSSAKPLVNTFTKDKPELTLIPVQIESTNEDILEDKHFRSATNDRPVSTQIITTHSVRGEISKNKPFTNTKDKPERTEIMIIQSVGDEMLKNMYSKEVPRTDNVQRQPSANVQDFADILILDVEYPPLKENVIMFKEHLCSLAAKLGCKNTKIKLFEEIYNDACLEKKQIMLPELFERCKYLFVYISKNHTPAKAIGKGLCEKDLVSYMSRSSVYSNIKTVLDCESWMYPDYRTDFNYFEYKLPKDCETYQSSLFLLLHAL